jgi:formylmethanofuran--tetrahydromethanopterin N-formyltransferase
MRFEGLGLKTVMQLVGLIMPFHGGIVASSSKPGVDTYTFMQATTNQRFAPTLKDKDEIQIWR